MGGKKSAKPAAAASDGRRIKHKTMGGEESANLEAAAVLSDGRRSERRRPPLPKEAPWLVFPYQVKGNEQNQAFYNIREPNNKTCIKHIPELSGKSFWQKHSHQGWLVVICDDRNYNYAPNWDLGDCFLWNPVLLETFQLPSLLPWYRYNTRYEFGLVDCVLSSPPRTSTRKVAYYDNADEPIVLLLFHRREGDNSNMFLVFCHPEDEQWEIKYLHYPWSKHMVDVFFIHSLCCVKNRLYLLSLDDQHLEIDTEKLWSDANLLLTVRKFKTSNNTGFPWRDSQDHINMESHYVESSDELFYVLIFHNGMQDIKVFNSVVVLKLDFSSMDWKVVTCLGDLVLFISKKSRFCCSASKLGLTGGCLYYTLPEDHGLYRWEVQSSRNSVILPCSALPNPWFSPGWIMIFGERQQKEEEYCMGREINLTAYGKNKNEKEGEFQETCTPWNILNADIKELVASYLHPLDYIKFRSVCKESREMVPAWKPTLATTSITKTSYLFPWMVFCRDNNDTVYNFVIPVRNNENNYLIKFSELLLGATIRFQKGGWLLMSREEILFFYNPFTRETINLPHLPEHNFIYVLPKHYFFSSICFCSLPTSADCRVFAIGQCKFGNARTITVYSISRGKQDWDIFNFDNAIQYMPLFNPPILHQGAFYCVDYNGIIGTFILEDNTWKVHGTPFDSYADTYRYPSFLVKSGEDLILVRLGCGENLVRIYKLNFPIMDWVDWVEVESLGKHMLFISHTSCVSAIAPNREMENKIYLPRRCLNGDGILFYSLERGRYDSFGGQHSSKSLYDTEGWRENCTWIEPNWMKFTPQELNWLEPTC